MMANYVNTFFCSFGKNRRMEESLELSTMQTRKKRIAKLAVVVLAKLRREFVKAVSLATALGT